MSRRPSPPGSPTAGSAIAGTAASAAAADSSADSAQAASLAAGSPVASSPVAGSATPAGAAAVSRGPASGRPAKAGQAPARAAGPRTDAASRGSSPGGRSRRDGAPSKAAGGKTAGVKTARGTAARGTAARGTAARGRAARGTEAGGNAAGSTTPADRLLAPASIGQGIPDATVARLPIYLRALYSLADHEVATVSSEELAAAAGVNSAKLRKDLSHLGSYGTRGVGYDVDYLIYQVSRELGLTQDWPVLIVGAGNLGRALANYGGFASRGFRIAAMVDCDPAVVGSVIARHTVRSAADIEDVIQRFDVSIGVIATPAPVAQNVCDRLVAAGVTSILNFAPVVLSVPSGVDVRKVDLSIELQILAFHAQRRGAGVRPGDNGRDGGRRLESVPGGELGLGIAAELAATTRLDVAAGLAGTGRRSVDARPEYGSPGYETGVQAVGT
jgi:redox-sensing transcriptional repressor